MQWVKYQTKDKLMIHQRMNSKLVECQVKAINIRFNGKHSLMLNYGYNETVHKIWQTCYKIWLKLEIT